MTGSPTVTARQHTGRRAEAQPALRRARLVLVAGAVLSVAAAFGPVWVVRAGVVLALLAAVTACWLLWRTLRAERRAAGERLLAQSRAHGAALHAERRQSAEVLAAVSDRLDACRRSLGRAHEALARRQREMTDLQHKLATQRGDNAVLRLRLAEQQAQRREATEAAEVVAMPRRGKPGGRPAREQARQA